MKQTQGNSVEKIKTLINDAQGVADSDRNHYFLKAHEDFLKYEWSKDNKAFQVRDKDKLLRKDNSQKIFGFSQFTFDERENFKTLQNAKSGQYKDSDLSKQFVSTAFDIRKLYMVKKLLNQSIEGKTYLVKPTKELESKIQSFLLPAMGSILQRITTKDGLINTLKFEQILY